MTDTARRRALAPRHLLAVAVLALGAVFWRLVVPDPVTGALEARLLDLRFGLRGPLEPPAEAVIVALDAPSLAAAPGLASRRAMLARAFERIAEAEPAAVAVDLLLVEETPADARLAMTLAAMPGLVLAAAVTGDHGPGPMAPELESALARSLVPVVRGGVGEEPVPLGLLPLARFVHAARLGHVNIARPGDRVARRLPVAVPVGAGDWLPALPVAAADLAAGRGPVVLDPGAGIAVGGRPVPVDADGRMTVNHFGPAGTLETASLADVAEGRVAPGRFAGRMVLVGATAESLRDSFATPYGSDVSGVEVLASAAVNLVRGEAVRRDGTAALLTAILALGAGFAGAAAGAVRLRLVALVATGAVLVGTALVLLVAFSEGLLWLDATAAMAAAALGGAVGGVARFRWERRLSDALANERRNLTRYVSPVLADRLAARAVPEFDRRRQQAAVLFVDVEGYTAMVERTDPVEVAGFLARLHGFFEDTAERHGGVVVDYLGDGAMVVFGLPEPAADDAARAFDCAEALIAPPGDLGGVRLRVSLHAGEIAAAVLGGPRQGHVTVTGDTVNVAARLQESAKAAGAVMVASREALDAAGGGALRKLSPLGSVPVRGREQRIEIFGTPFA